MNDVTTATVLPPAGIGKNLVHKHDPSQVLLSGLRRTGEDTFLITADWRNTGRPLTARGSHHDDAVLLTETIRQTFPLLSHAGFDVPFGHHLLWDEYRFALDLAALRAADAGGRPDLHVRCHDIARRRGRVSALTLSISVRDGGRWLGNAHTRFSIQTPAVYQRLRGAHGDAEQAMATARSRPLPPPPASGEGEFRDSVLSPTDDRGRWQLRVDTHHPVYFDHPSDHAPGILLLEAAQQAARSMRHASSGVTEAMETLFHRYIELDSPCWVEATPLPNDQQDRTRILVTMRQDGQLCFTALVSLAGAPPAR
ncbi:hypothetical protein FH609_024135 [Streptomyces sp. 3MP-14]|uniref:A-factor biosynthesis hotdog domain-containing protein n=1 Tax=Streptomyces mimosae TaxID=2586635 RepID=A0A5N6A4E3_9ACTN|nr:MULTISPECIES: ScbA/BarX family gamma-butyrolactone biosynthesis protein [Streptomyces]KAB8162278.1 hypothetical protein FH607_022600 [Streptomyces mimosae]KAB8173823.1 hypothetical protein FH609_024135 [Streptomyces sp. 3MP-14]